MARPQPQTLTELLEEAAARHGNRLAVASQEGLRTFELDYVALERASRAVAMQLADEHGLGRGDRVLLWAPNSARLVAVQFGILRAGMIAVPIDQGARPDFVRAVANQTGARALVSLPGRAGKALPPLHDVAAFDLDTDAAVSGPPPAPADPALIVFTSGTTGQPKGVVLTHRNMTQNALAAAEIVPERMRLRLLSILPLSHMLEQTAGLHLPLLSGGSVHYARSLQPTAIFRDIARRRVNGMVVVPRFLQMLAARIDQRMLTARFPGLWQFRQRLADRLPFRLRRMLFADVHRAFGGRLDFFLCGGATLPTATFDAWERMGVRVLEGYGTTECAPVIAANTYHDRLSGSVGLPLTGVETRVADDGELQVRGANVFGGYWQAPDPTARAFDGAGWYRTGDIASIGPEGRLRIEGRLSDRIVLPSGMNVYPDDVEAALVAEEAVEEAVVIGLAGSDGAEHVHAAICCADGMEQAHVEGAISSANMRLASHQRILGFTIWQGDLPRTPLHKVKRAAVRAALSTKDTGPALAPHPGKPRSLATGLLQRAVPGYTGQIAETTRIDTDLGLDSLGRIELAALIEAETGLEFSEEEINGLETVADLETLLRAPPDPGDRLGFDDWPLTPTASVARGLLQALFLFPVHGAFCRPFAVEAQETVEALSPPFLFIANHASHVDTVSIIRAMPPRIRRRMVAAAAADYFYRSRPVGWIASLLLNTFPFSRKGNVRESLDRCGELCDRGWSILIYPEGTRSPDGSLLPFKNGVSLLAAGLRVPVVPIAVSGGHDVLPKGRGWPRRAAVTIRFGAPREIAPGTDAATVTSILRDAVSAELAILKSDRREERDGQP